MIKVESKVISDSVCLCILMHKFETYEEANRYIENLKAGVGNKKTVNSRVTNE